MRSERGPVTLARRVTLITLVVAAFVAIPSGAEAKGFGVRSVAVHGPGLSGPLVVGRLEFQGTSGQDSGNLWERVFSDYAPTLVPPSSLGPRYLIEYRLGLTLVSGPRVLVIRQDLYPYAESGPLAFTLPHQIWPGPGPPEPIPSRWHAYPQVLITTLQFYGLPAAASPALAPHRKVSGPGSQEPPIWIWPAGLLLLGSIGSIYLWLRGRRRGDPGGRLGLVAQEGHRRLIGGIPQVHRVASAAKPKEVTRELSP